MFVPIQILYISPKSSSGDLDEFLSLQEKSFSVELLHDKNTAPLGPGAEGPPARPRLLLAAAVVTLEDLPVTANFQSSPPLCSMPADVLCVALEGSLMSSTLSMLVASVLPG